MIFIFEDKKTDLLSKLFMHAYKECSFYYTEGNGNIISTVEELLTTTNEVMMVFLDTIPDNKDTIRIYKKLSVISRKNDFRIIVMPIVCAEYYFILSLSDSIFTSHVGLDICKNKEYWRNSKLIETDEDRKFTKNFEKYCKLILHKCVKDCARHSGEGNNLHGFYYDKDCLCCSSDSNCEKISLKDKAVNYVSQYPTFPGDGYLGKCDLLGDVDIWFIHRSLVDDFNRMVDKYKSIDENHAFSTIKYIKE